MVALSWETSMLQRPVKIPHRLTPKCSQKLRSDARKFSPQTHRMKLPSPSPTENEEFTVKKLSTLLQQLKAHPSSYLFLEPVDPVKHNCPDYFEKIQTPMDLEKVTAKLEEYSDLKSFCDDVCLMIQNAFTYNPEGHFVRDHARSLGVCLDDQAIQLGHHIDWSSFGIDDLHEKKRSIDQEEKPRKRRLGSYKLRQSVRFE
jgi:hypothetical protein